MTRKTLTKRLEEGQGVRQAFNNTSESYKKMKSNLFKRTEQIITNENLAYFLTFTIAPEHYEKDKATLKKSIRKALNEVSPRYIMNEDYGTINERLHFHVIANTYNPIITQFIKGDNYWKDCPYYGYGHVHVAQIDKSPEKIKSNKKKISEYIAKATNHAIKTTSGAITYSRRKRPQL